MKSDLGDERGANSRAVFIGCQNVGKTCLIHRLVHDTYSGQGMTLPSLGTAFHVLHCETAQGDQITVGLWDTPGQVNYRDLMLPPLRHANSIVIVFDLTNSETFLQLKDYLKKARSVAPSQARVILVGNKSDLDAAREVAVEQMWDYGAQIGAATTIQVSAATGEGIDNLKAFLAVEPGKPEGHADDIQLAVTRRREEPACWC
jgi:small GTP-binding protein